MNPEDDKAEVIAELKATVAALKADGALPPEALDHAKALRKCFSALGACYTKTLDSHGQTHDDLETLRDHLNEVGHHAKALADGLKPGAAASEDQVGHAKALMKCFGKGLDAHQSVMDGHDQTEEHIKSFAPHLEDGGDHVKELLKAARRKPDSRVKPGEDDGDGADQEDPNDDDSDVELAAEVARRKRLIEIAARA
jgi:hypothetical protein